MYRLAYLTDRGLKRSVNEDELLIDSSCGIFVVSDGMGGHERGDIASKIIVDCFQETLCEDDETIPYFDNETDDETIPYLGNDSDDETITYENEDWKIKNLNRILNSVVQISTSKIKKYAKENLTMGQIGATVVGLYKVEFEEKMALFHLGDSRAYRVRNRKIEQLTVDHSKYEKMKQSGKYSEKELSRISRNSITKAIGNFKEIPLEINYIDIESNDIYFLCSDGVSDLCSKEELLKILLEEANDLEKAVIHIKNLVYARGAKDNLSMIVISYQR